MTCDCCALVPRIWLSHGITSRPLLVWMPTPGPVAYQVQSGFLTSRVMSAGLLQVAIIVALREPHGAAALAGSADDHGLRVTAQVVRHQQQDGSDFPID